MMPLDSIQSTRAVLDTLETEPDNGFSYIRFPTKVMAFYAACAVVQESDHLVTCTRYQLRRDEDGSEQLWGYTENDPGDDGEGWHQFVYGVTAHKDGGYSISFFC